MFKTGLKKYLSTSLPFITIFPDPSFIHTLATAFFLLPVA